MRLSVKGKVITSHALGHGFVISSFLLQSLFAAYQIRDSTFLTNLIYDLTVCIYGAYAPFLKKKKEKKKLRYI